MKRRRFLRYSFLTTGLGLLRPSRIFGSYAKIRKLFLNKVQFIWAGGLSTNSISVRAKLTSATTSARLIASTDAAFTNPIYGPFVSVNAATNNVAQLSISGLSAATQYYYAVEADGVLDNAADAVGRIKTAASGPQSFKFSIASCNNSGAHPVFYRIKDKAPLFHITHGDFHYADPNSATDINVHRSPFEVTLAQPAIKDFLLNTAIAYMWDDHDYCGDNTNSFAVGRTNARLAYQEYVPHYPLVAGSGNVPIYQSFVVGRVKFILSDLRSEKGAAGTSMMGAAQKTWFKNECLSAHNNNQAIIWVSSVPWGGSVDIDTWAGFTAERTELSDFFKTTGVQNMLIICGDAHMIAMDSGVNHDFSTGGNPFKYPVLQAAAVNQTGSFRGGTFSEGFFINPTQQHGQYAAIDIQDTGGNTIAVNITGYRVDSAGVESVLLTYAINFSVPSVLPVRFTNFSVTENSASKKPLLQWEFVASGADTCKTMVVERSRNGIDFTPLHQQACSTAGASVAHYSFTDDAPLAGKAYYRIKIVDGANRIIYSSVESIAFAQKLQVSFLANPASDRLLLNIWSPVAAAAQYSILDMQVRPVLKGQLPLSDGANKPIISIANLSAGFYFFRLQMGDEVVTEKFVII